MYVVSHDIVVSTYSAHFHELAHLLMNFKLKQPHLYTHPFFLEGLLWPWAVGAGRRRTFCTSWVCLFFGKGGCRWMNFWMLRSFTG